MTVNIGNAKHMPEYDGQTVHFCSQGCRDKFAADPGKYTAGPPEADATPQGTLYTCPMHPEIVRDAPGTCPICGMALEPMGGACARSGKS